MSVVFKQVPGQLDLQCIVGNDFSMDVDTDVNLTGYTFYSYIVLEETPVVRKYPITVSALNLALGQVRLSLDSSQTTEIGQVSGKLWYFGWNSGTGNVRNILRGKFQLDRF